MGPRSHERGNIVPMMYYLAMITLQWGRVLTNAETGMPRSSPGSEYSLQWGRVLTNAETGSQAVVGG